eukprot:224146_1
MSRWGVDLPDPEAAFAEVDLNGGGQVLFDEFAVWALRQGLTLEQDASVVGTLGGGMVAADMNLANSGSPSPTKGKIRHDAGTTYRTAFAGSGGGTGRKGPLVPYKPDAPRSRIAEAPLVSAKQRAHQEKFKSDNPLLLACHASGAPTPKTYLSTNQVAFSGGKGAPRPKPKAKK